MSGWALAGAGHGGAWGACCSAVKGRSQAAKVLGAGRWEREGCTWSYLRILPAELPHPPESTCLSSHSALKGGDDWVLFWFWFGLIFHVLAPWPLALAKVSALWMMVGSRAS